MFKISCIQLRSSNNIKDNLKKTIDLINKAINQKTDFIITPEASNIMSLNKKEIELKILKKEDNIYCNSIQQLAKKNKKWILIGSLITRNKNNKIVNRSILINAEEGLSFLNRSILKEKINDLDGACFDAKKAVSLGEESSENKSWIQENC